MDKSRLVPMHLARPAGRRAVVPAKAAEPAAPAAPAYAPGHFLALVRRHDWPPCFEPQLRVTREVEQSEISRINRERRMAQGETGTIVGLSARADALAQQRLTTNKVMR
jgi:hypothetical protein